MNLSSSSLTTTLPVIGQAAIEFKDVRLGFAEGEVLRGVTFSAQERETVILLGETGTGKTLLLKLASGLLRPDSGSIQVLGKDISGMAESDLLEIRRQIGFVFQEGALFDSLTVGENVAYRLHEDGVDGEEIESRVKEVLRFVELAHTIDSLPSELSGGMRRRVSIALGGGTLEPGRSTEVDLPVRLTIGQTLIDLRRSKQDIRAATPSAWRGRASSLTPRNLLWMRRYRRHVSAVPMAAS